MGTCVDVTFRVLKVPLTGKELLVVECCDRGVESDSCGVVLGRRSGRGTRAW